MTKWQQPKGPLQTREIPVMAPSRVGNAEMMFVLLMRRRPLIVTEPLKRVVAAGMRCKRRREGGR